MKCSLAAYYYVPNSMLDSDDGSLSPIQFSAVILMEYTVLCTKVTFHCSVKTVILAGWYGAVGEIEMV